MEPHGFTDPGVSRAWGRAWAIAGAVLAAVLLTPILVVAYWLYHTERWEGDVAVVVRSAGDDGFVSAEIVAPGLPPDAVDPRADRRGPVQGTAPGVRVGERLTCRIQQSDRVEGDFEQGPRSRIVACHR